MTTYDEAGLTALTAVQFDDSQASIDAIYAMTGSVHVDPTHERVLIIPQIHGRTRMVFIGDWVVDVGAPHKIVMSDTAFNLAFVETS